MRLSVRHVTTLEYDAPTGRRALRLRLYPPTFDSQRLLAWSVSVGDQKVAPLLITATGDRESIWTSGGGGESLTIVAEGVVETSDTAGVVHGLKEGARPAVYLRATSLTEADDRITELARSTPAGEPLQRAHALAGAIADSLVFKPGAVSSGAAAQALKAGEGGAQDFAHVFIGAARCLRMPARFVFGYHLRADGESGALHAWAETHLPEIGWVGFDAANRLCPTDRYVRVACGLDAADVAPIRGNVAGNRQERHSASVDIRPAQGQAQVQTQTQQ